MLVYHFGSREGLMREILMRARERENARIEAWFHAGGKPRTLPQFLRWYWKCWSAPRFRPGIRLIFELYALALRNPREYPGVLEDPIAYWQKLTKRAGIASEADDAEATLLLAATRGLLLDLCATETALALDGRWKPSPSSPNGVRRRRNEAARETTG